MEYSDGENVRSGRVTAEEQIPLLSERAMSLSFLDSKRSPSSMFPVKALLLFINLKIVRSKRLKVGI